ncbi:MAG TPA: hypothetical protein VE622_05095 [Nitrososphaeraceae archaeon]|nr:hypothetical protein [Nitrososphaeraceae archaeon]
MILAATVVAAVVSMVCAASSNSTYFSFNQKTAEQLLRIFTLAIQEASFGIGMLAHRRRKSIILDFRKPHAVIIIRITVSLRNR